MEGSGRERHVGLKGQRQVIGVFCKVSMLGQGKMLLPSGGLAAIFIKGNEITASLLSGFDLRLPDVACFVLLTT